MLNSTEEDEVEGIDCSPCCRSEKFKCVLVSLLLGQILSLCLCGTGVTSQFLVTDFNVSTPITQSFISYFLLCLVYGTKLACTPENNENGGGGGIAHAFQHHWWKYAILAFIDVEANCLVIAAYKYTNLASIQLLDCFTIPVVLLLSFIFLYVRYLLSHILGVTICLIGIGCLVWGDFENGKDVGGNNKLMGDAFCLMGAALYGVSNVAEEFLVKKFSRIEYLGMIGFFGSIISGVQLIMFERESLALVEWHRYEIIVLYLAFAAFMFAFYSLVSVFIQRTSATMYNLSILTADFYTLVAGLLIFKYTFHSLYFASFFLVLTGSIVYALKATHSRRDLDLMSSAVTYSHNGDGGGSNPTGIDFLSFSQSLNSNNAVGSTTILPIEGGSGEGVVKLCKIHGPVLQQSQSRSTSRMT